MSEGELERIRRRIREWAERGMTRGEIARAVERVSGYVQFVYCADPVGYEECSDACEELCSVECAKRYPKWLVGACYEKCYYEVCEPMCMKRYCGAVS